MISSGEFANNKDIVKNLLHTYGYPVLESSDYINTAALWRGGVDAKSVAIYYRDNLCLDFVDGSKFDIKKLISLVANKLSTEELDAFLKTKNITLSSPSPKISQIKIFDTSILSELVPVHDYWNKRGIDDLILSKTLGGIYNGKGIFKGKYLFPIFNSKSQIVGLAGRDVSGNNGEFKWILRGAKSNWCYPAFINSARIKEKKSVFLVEGVGDMLALMQCGIDNVLVLFGVELNLAIINYLLKVGINNIYISTNDDSAKNMAGNNAAEKISKKLLKYFSHNQVKIVLPSLQKDWNDILTNNGKQVILEQLKNYI